MVDLDRLERVLIQAARRAEGHDLRPAPRPVRAAGDPDTGRRAVPRPRQAGGASCRRRLARPRLPRGAAQRRPAGRRLFRQPAPRRAYAGPSVGPAAEAFLLARQERAYRVGGGVAAGRSRGRATDSSMKGAGGHSLLGPARDTGGRGADHPGRHHLQRRARRRGAPRAARAPARVDDPFVLVEEINDDGPAILIVRGLRGRLGDWPTASASWASCCTKIVTNRTSRAWHSFELELRERLEQTSTYEDGLSFGQATQRQRPFTADRYAHRRHDRRAAGLGRVLRRAGGPGRDRHRHRRRSPTTPPATSSSCSSDARRRSLDCRSPPAEPPGHRNFATMSVELSTPILLVVGVEERAGPRCGPARTASPGTWRRR